MNTKKPHTFHIPVMGTGFTLDTPIKVAKYGISSVISLVDDTLIEEMRRFYCEKTGEKYVPITKGDEDYRARRITSYLNLVDRIVKKQFRELKSSAFEVGSEITKYFELLPDTSPLKALYHKMLRMSDLTVKRKLQQKLRDSIKVGQIDVNIMTKLDRENYAKDGTPLAAEYSDALAALRGYAQSTLRSAIVFSAGINQRLYSYLAEFKDFYANKAGVIKKKIVLKVSDYRSANIQGRFLAKKGLWVSEFRVESGLNCGGHTFPSNGVLLGPILEEFKNKRQELITTLHKIYIHALKLKNRVSFVRPHPVRITAQGGIGTAEEDRFLREQYQLDGTGWGTPFLLCPEVTNVDERTLNKLSDATEDDIYLSNVSPLGVPFNNLRGSLSDTEKERRAQEGHPGSPCPKGHLAANTDFSQRPWCTASRQFQKVELEQLAKMDLSEAERQARTEKILNKACICHDLGGGLMIKNSLNGKVQQFPAVCPGPNLAYFSKIVSLGEIVGHIYGRTRILNSIPRPHVFIKELQININLFMEQLQTWSCPQQSKQAECLRDFKNNLLDGIAYYQGLFGATVAPAGDVLQDLDALKGTLLRAVSLSPGFATVTSAA